MPTCDRIEPVIRVPALPYFVLDWDFHMGKFSHTIHFNLDFYSFHFVKGLRHVHIQFRKMA